MWKMLLIVSIIVMIADVAFFLKPADLSDRTGICVTLCAHCTLAYTLLLL